VDEEKRNQSKPEPAEIEAITGGSSSFDSIFWILAFGVLGALAIVGLQIYLYERFGEWHPLPVMAALSWWNMDWISFPDQWGGVHTILDAFPLWLALLIVGFVPLWWHEILSDKIPRNTTCTKTVKHKKRIG
jgi:hypothetical protein